MTCLQYPGLQLYIEMALYILSSMLIHFHEVQEWNAWAGYTIKTRRKDLTIIRYKG